MTVCRRTPSRMGIMTSWKLTGTRDVLILREQKECAGTYKEEEETGALH
jgi:hypothetical protein